MKYNSNFEVAKHIAYLVGCTPKVYSSNYEVALDILKQLDIPVPTKYTISFNIGDAEGIAPDDIKAEEGEVITLPYADTFEKAGYSFDGWFIDGVKHNAGDEYTVIANKTAVADYVIRWDYQGLTFTALEDDSAISMTHFGGNNPILQYSKDGDNWIDWQGEEIDLDKDEQVAFRGKSSYSYHGISFSTREYSTFVMTGKISASGNIMSLLDGGECTATTLTYGYNFYKLFANAQSLIDARDLKLTATIVNERSYYYMFQRCTSLVTAPELPATTLAKECYFYMFQGCSSLVTAPELPATTLKNYCYYNMFNGCSSLVNAPELPATTLALNCYGGMFLGCSSLVTAPELPATTLASGCYVNMFNGCSSLVNAPELLPATTLESNCYDSMFIGCTSLVTAPELPATTLASGCYNNMFRRCTNLNKITAYASNISGFQFWVRDVSSVGDFYIIEGATYNLGTDGIPTKWTIHNI